MGFWLLSLSGCNYVFLYPTDRTFPWHFSAPPTPPVSHGGIILFSRKHSNDRRTCGRLDKCPFNLAGISTPGSQAWQGMYLYRASLPCMSTATRPTLQCWPGGGWTLTPLSVPWEIYIPKIIFKYKICCRQAALWGTGCTKWVALFIRVGGKPSRTHPTCLVLTRCLCR